MGLPPAYRKKWETTLTTHKEALEDMEITDIAQLIRWASNLAIPKMTKILETAEQTKNEEK